MIREKYNLIQELQKKSEELTGKKRLAMAGSSDFPGANNLMRNAMNSKHKSQRLAIDNPEFPFFYDGKENVNGEFSSFYTKLDKDYEVFEVCKKYEQLLKGKCYVALYFLHCKEDDSYKVVERKEVENLTENFGFEYNNDILDSLEVGETVKKGTVVSASSSYDEYGNTCQGINGRILYAAHPAVQDDAIICSKSFAERMVTNNVQSKTIAIDSRTILLNLYGKDGEYQGIPNIGDVVTNGIIAATRKVKESRMFSDMRDQSLRNINFQTDTMCYGDGEIVDINVYNNSPNIETNKANKILMQYYHDARWFYTKVYKTCKAIINSGSKNIDRNINHWMRLAMNYLDTQAEWAFNDNVFTGMMVEILVRRKDKINVGRKIVGRAGNKTVVSQIWDDDEMPYLTTEYTTDEYGVKHPAGVRERVDLITNPLAIINRTIPMVMYEGSITFILDKVRKHAATMGSIEEQKEFMFDVIRMLNPTYADEVEALYNGLTDHQKKNFIRDSISVDNSGHLMTNNGLYIRWEAFTDQLLLRDAIISIYEKYGDILKPYNIFIPKPKWGRDIYIGQDYVGYQYIMMLKQSGEKGFSARSAGAISDEGLPEKSNGNRTAKESHSTKPINLLLSA